MNQELEIQKSKIIDEEHLRLLKIFHYIFAGIYGFFAFIPLLYVVMGAIFFFIPAEELSKKTTEPELAPEVLGGIFIGIGLLAFVFILLFAIAFFIAGKFIAQRKHRWFCYLVAGFNCLSVPFGTIFGILTFMVLSRASIDLLFKEKAS